MAGRPPKPTDILLFEGKSHRTKAEFEQRKAAELSLVTGIHMEMWSNVKANKKAAAEFARVSELLAVIGKDDALQEAVVNRYCLLHAECIDFEKKCETFTKSMGELKSDYQNDKIDSSEYYKLINDMQKNIISVDKQIMSKRSMMLAIEKENLMTIASALRSIPKKQEKPPETDFGRKFGNV